jgi:hypothetical protein
VLFTDFGVQSKDVGLKFKDFGANSLDFEVKSKDFALTGFLPGEH